MKKSSKFLSFLLVLAIILPGMVNAETPAPESVVRLSGPTRIETSIAASKEAFDDGEADIVVLAGYNGEVDALTGTLLAHSKDAPILLTYKNNISTELKAELERLNPTSIYILGGTNVVSQKVENELVKKYLVERVSGSNRADTAHEVARRVKKTSDHVFLALGYDNKLADALAIGPASAVENDPVLLTQTEKLPEATKDTLEYLKTKDVTIVGGTKAVSENVAEELETMNIVVTRINGSKREETALAITKKYFEDSEKAILAYGWQYADALVGGYLGAREGAPILLTNRNVLATETEKYLEDNIFQAYVLGGGNVINEGTFAKILKAVNYNENEIVKAVEDFEAKLATKEDVLELVEDDELREEVSKLHTTVFNKVQKMKDKDKREALLDRLDKAHTTTIAATSVKALQNATENLNDDTLEQAKLRLSNANTNIRFLEDGDIKDALAALVKTEKEKIDAYEEAIEENK